MTFGFVLLVTMLRFGQPESCTAAGLFCRELNYAQSLQAVWMDADRQAETFGSFSGRCDMALLNAVRRARRAAAESFLAYAAYYRKWLDSAREQSQLLASVAARHAVLGLEIESALAVAEREHAELIRKRDALQKNIRVASFDEFTSLNGLIAISEQRVENYRRARENWRDAERDADAGKEKSTDLGAEASSFLRLSESERILWDAHYEGRQLRLWLACHEIP